MPYSDNPTRSSGGGYSDFLDPPTNDKEYQDGSPQGPDSTLFSFLADINDQNNRSSQHDRSSSPVSNNSDESSDGTSLEYGDGNDTALYSDDLLFDGHVVGAPNQNQFIWHLTPGKAGKEIDSVFVDGYYPSSSSTSQGNNTLRNTIKMALLGFSLGIVVMLVTLLMTSNGPNKGGESRLGAPGGINETANGLLDDIDESIADVSISFGESDDMLYDAPKPFENIDSYQIDNETEEMDPSSQEPTDEIEKVDASNSSQESEPPLDQPSLAAQPETTGKDNVDNGSAQEEVNDDSLAVAKPNENQTVEKVQPQTTGNGESIPQQPEKEIDINNFCAGCRYKGSNFSCGQQIAYMMSKYAMTEVDAKTDLMQLGHCPDSPSQPNMEQEAVQENPHVSSTGEPLPTMFDNCRKRPKEGDALSHFCGFCQWKASGMNCFKRVLYLREYYGNSEEQAMLNLMEQGHCKDERTDKEMETLREQGLEYWCDFCQFQGFTCHYRLDPCLDPLASNPEGYLSAQLSLLSDGACKLPPWCDDEAATEASSSTSTNSDVIDNEVAGNDTNTIENTTVVESSSINDEEQSENDAVSDTHDNEKSESVENEVNVTIAEKANDEK